MIGVPHEASPPWLGELVDQGLEAVVVFDDRLRILYSNAAAADLLGYPARALVGRDAFGLVHPDDIDRAAANVTGVGGGAMPDPGLLRLLRGDGDWAHYQLRPRRLELPGPPDGPGGITAVSVRDNSNEDAHWLFLAQLAKGEDFHTCIDRFTLGLSSRVDGPMAVTYETDGVRSFAGNFPPDLAWPDPIPAGSPWAIALATGEASLARVGDLPEPLGTRAASLGLEALVVVPVHDPTHPTPACIVQGPYEVAMGEIVMTALARRPKDALSIAFERRDAMVRLHRMAMSDPLTGLDNRTSFFEALELLDRDRTPYTICSIDIDRFKEVNDSHGHQLGDDILLACARRLRQVTRAGDVVARLGGDEFAVVHVGIGADDAPGVALRLVELLNRPVDVGGRTFDLGASVGAASAGDNTCADAVLAASDAALYEAKRAGRGTWRSADPA